MKLANSTVLITGGSAGIGLALAREFVRLGNKVIITGRSLSKLEAAKAEVPALVPIQSDVADAESVRKLADTIRQNHPELDTLVNNAGIFVARNLTSPSKDLKEFTKEVDINISGTMRMTSALIDLMIQNKGCIINISSGLAFVPLMIAPIYCATKAAIHSYSITLRQQLKEMGVEVIELAPPAVKTELTADLPDDAGFKIITTEELVQAAFAGFRAGNLEICPGQSKQLRFMSRLAPSFINRQLETGSKNLMPPPEV